jgi:septal ring-binding cell division protein DamX/type II secretory pathway predicted ATPase ExeA
VPDSNEFFATPEINAHLDLIRHLIENSELVPLVRGVTGIGKSLLAAKLQQSAPENWLVCHISAEPTLQPERLLAFLARCSGIADVAGDLMQRLADRFELLRKRGRIPVLLIDDAQRLPPTSLITLLRLFERQVEGARLVSIVLFANEQIDLLLTTPQLQVMSPQAIQAIDLPVLSLEEAKGFMLFLLKSEGLSDSFVLDEGKLARLYKESGGVPGLLATRILNDIGQRDGVKQSFFSGYRKQLILGGVPFFAVVLLLLMFQGPINTLFESASEPKRNQASPIAEPQTAEISLPFPADTDKDIKPQEPSGLEPEQLEPLSSEAVTALPEAELTVPESPTIAEMTTSSVEVVPSLAPAVTDFEPVESVSATEDTPIEQVEVVAAPSPDVLEQRVSPEPILLIPEEPASSRSHRDEATAVVAPQATPYPLPEIPEVISETEAVKDIAATKDRAEQGAEVARPAVEPKPKDEYSKAMEWVRSQPPQFYTLQLIAVENIKSLQRFIKANTLQGQVYTLKTQRNGAPWYTLLWGAFTNRDEAMQAQSKLPPAVRKGGVWARSFASLK